LDIVFWMCTLLCAFGIAYNTTFSGATLSIGRALSATGSSTGYQNAVTPPWQTKLALATWALTITVLILSWLLFGFGRAGLSMLIIVIGVLVARRIIPKEDGPHYRRLIIVSMAHRYADYVGLPLISVPKVPVRFHCNSRGCSKFL
jgi:hypothetical protein